MPTPLHIVVCAGISPDPLQTLEPTTTPTGPGLKNELVLPAVLDPWAASALYEAANLAQKNPGSKLYLVSLGPKAKLQQVMMTVAQKVPFELVPIDGPIGGFPDAHSTAADIAETIAAIPSLDRSKLFSSADGSPPPAAQASRSRSSANSSASPTSSRASIRSPSRRRSFEVLERIEGGRHQVSVCAARPPSSAGPPATWPSLATTRKSAWPICAPSCPPCKKPSPQRSPQRPPLRLRQPAQTAAHHPRRQRPNPRPDRRRTSRVDRSQIMESILVLTHADETNTALTKASLEAITAGLDLAARLGAPSPSASSPQTQPTSPRPSVRSTVQSPAKPSPSPATPPTPPPAKPSVAPRQPPSSSPPAAPVLPA